MRWETNAAAEIMIDRQAKIYVAGHRGLVGSAIVRALSRAGYNNLVLRTHDELDLTDQAAVAGFFAMERPRYVFLAAAKVGGILANATYPAEFIFQNLMIQANVIESAYRADVDRLLALGSSCIYPNSRLSRSEKSPCCRVLSNRQTGPTPWPRSQELKCAGLTISSTARDIWQPCQPISTAQATTTIWKPPMSSPRYPQNA